MRIVSVRPGGACSRERHTKLAHEGHRALSRALRSIERDEVSAARVGPAGNARVSQALLQIALHQLKARTQNGRMLCHMGTNTSGIVQEAHVSQLGELLWGDALDGKGCPQLCDVVGTCRHEGHAA